MSFFTNRNAARLFFIVLMICGFSPSAGAQNVLDNAGLSVTSAAAYSTRKLSTTYAGAAIRVRRSSDNKEADIAFDGTGQVSASSIATMVVGGATSSFSSYYTATSCFISIWYDQSGNGRNITQATLASQPGIVNAGVPYIFNGKQAVYFNGTSNVMTVPFAASVINAQGSFSTLLSQPALQINFPALIAWGGASPYGPGFGPLDVAGKFGLYTTTGPTNVTMGPVTTNTNYVLNATWTGTSVTESRNKTVITGTLGNAFSASLSSGLLGQDNPSSAYFNGTVPELIVFSTALTTPNRQALENNQYNVFLTPATGLAFDGVDDYVDGTNAFLPTGNAARTVEAWFKTSSAATGTIFNFGTAATNQRFGVLVVSGKIYVVGESNDYTTTAPVVNDGLWHHTAVTFDGTTVNVYVDGVLAGTTIKTYNTTGAIFRIGLRIGGGEPFTGSIDEVRVWNRALLQSEVQNNMSCELNPSGQTGLVALYHLNQGNINADNTITNTATDASNSNIAGTLNNFALTGSSSNWAVGNATGNCSAPATALNFDGVNDNVNCGSGASISSLGLSGFTLEAWVNLSNTTTINSVIRKTGDYNLYVLNGNVHVEYWPNGVGTTNFQHLTGTIAIANNTWTHIAATWNGSSASLYVNGVLNNGAANSALVSGTENLYLGQSSIYVQPMTGSLDEVRIWNRPLCQSEIQNNMNCALNPAGQTGLKALYHFDQGFVNSGNSAVTILNDLSGNNNNGTLTNFALSGAASNWVAGTVSSNCTVFAPSTLAGSAGGAQVCQSTTVQAPGTYYLDPTCNLIANVNPSGASPLTGIINTCVKVDAAVQVYKGLHYVQRHYDITPVTNPATATGTVTLYYTQGEFNAYNAVRGIQPALPTSGADATGIANVLITQFHGTGTAPGNYTGAGLLINPVDSKIIYNSTLSRWEITFDVTGFSGFFLHTSSLNGTLPVNLLGFSGRNSGDMNLLEWTTSAEQNSRLFELERSADGLSFVKAGTVAATGNSSTGHHYTYADDITTVHQSMYYYRLKMIDADGSFLYSVILKINTKSRGFNTTVLPNPFTDQLKMNIETELQELAGISIRDISGRLVQQKSLVLQKGVNAVSVSDLNKIPAGIYVLTIKTNTQQQTVKLVKQ